MWQIVSPRESDWCVSTIGGKDVDGGTVTDYWYEYVKGDKPTRQEAPLFVPAGWKVLEFTIRKVTR